MPRAKKLTEHKLRLTSAQIVPLGFLLLILVGAGLLMLPFASAKGESTSFLTALFTSVTSVCVTGLVVVDTFSHWSFFGQAVILILIQLGGLGFIAVVSALMLAARRKFSLKSHVLIRDAFDLYSIRGTTSFLRKVLITTFVIEGVGAVCYFAALLPQMSFGKALWSSVFTAVSAFCNAGIDVFGPDSLAPFAANPAILIITMVMIISGGIGFVVIFDLHDVLFPGKTKSGHRRKVTMRRHTTLVLLLTGTLILLGAVLFFLTEHSNPNTIGAMSPGNQILNSVFQSVTFRTAGFATFPQQNMYEATSLIGCIWMFIGGSPVGTAGGIKTVTFFIVLANIMTFIRDRNETVILGRSVSSDLIRKATAIFTVNLLGIVIFTCLLSVFDGLRLADGLYEITSAIGTVGLSRGITPTLSDTGRIIVMIAMYFGRVGPISMALFFNTGHSEKNAVSYSEGKYYVG